MKAFVKYIAVIDSFDKIHHIQFAEGVNVVTGKSSTGKSAILEIFDYCFGSSEFNIPDGVITENAILYFVVIALKDTYLVLGRTKNKNIHYLTFETSEDLINDVQNFNKQYFQNLDSLQSQEFNKELNKYFKINIEDTDEDLEDRVRRYNNSKKPAPSFRHFTSFILQHQNLIANKHALFYRFDEKEKKEQTIDQFKIFLGLVDAAYFPLKQKLAEKNREKKQKEIMKERYLKVKESVQLSLADILQDYEIKTNQKLFDVEPETIVSNPKKYLDYLENFEITTSESGDENIVKRSNLQKEYNKQLAEIRRLQNLISNIEVSILYAKDFSNQKSNIATIQSKNYDHKNCTFCGQQTTELISEQNKLTQALEWFNTEMNKSTYTIQSFESDRKVYEGKIKTLKEDAKKIKQEIYLYDKIIKDLDKNRSIEEQALKIKLKVETFLETIEENSLTELQEEIDQIEKEIEEIENTLKDDYDVSLQLSLAARNINQQMNIIGKTLDFEPTYKNNLNLKFDIETFELYQQNRDKGKDTNKVYLRSMGSGANWLHTHVSLFTSLLYYFCSLKEECIIPTFLFIDQPSQVYFPSEIDKADIFDGKKLKEASLKSGDDLEEKYNEDLESVTNLYYQLYKFCETTFNDTGIRPQLIITDHADNLNLNEVEFEKIVRARWRKDGEGFINLS